MKILRHCIIGLALFAVSTVAQAQTTLFEQPLVQDLQSPNKNLYLRVYNDIKNTTPQIAVQRVAGFADVSVEDITALRDGEISLGTKGLCGDFFDGVMTCEREILDALEFETSLMELEVDMKEQLQASEIWANGSLADSGFDLIVDLNIIDVILFGKRANIFLQRFEDEEKDQFINPQRGLQELANIPRQPGDIDNNDGDIFDPNNPLNFPPFDESGSLNQCIDPSILDLRVSPLARSQTDGISETTISLFPFARSVPPGSAGFPQIPVNNDRECSGEKMFGFFCMETQFNFCAPDLQVGSTEDALYAEFGICLDIQFVAGGDKSAPHKARSTERGQDSKSFIGYSERDNCTNCHLEFINQELEELVAVPLTPRRNTKAANFEISSAFDFLAIPKFNVTVSTVPVLREVRDTFIEPSSGANDADEDQEGKPNSMSVNAIANRFDERIQASQDLVGEEYVENKDQEQREIRYIAPGAPIDQSSQRLSAQSEAFIQARERALQEMLLTSKLEDNTKYWEAVNPEFRNFHTSMRGIQRMYHVLGTEVSQTITGNSVECKVKQDTN